MACEGTTGSGGSASFQEQLLDAIRQAHELFLTSGEPREVFQFLLSSLVGLTGSEYGFLDEVLTGDDGKRFKLNLAISDIAWDAPSKALLEQLQSRSRVFPLRENYAGAPAFTGHPVIAEDAGMGMSGGGLPHGHPALASYLGLPLKFGGELVGVAGIANRPGGYDEAVAKQLEPLLSTCASIIRAMRQREQQRKQTREIEEYAQSLSAMLNVSPESSFLMQVDGTILAGNEVFASRLGHTLAEVVGRNVYDFIPSELTVNRKKMVQEALQTGQPVQWNDVRNGRVFVQRIAPVLNPSGEADCVAVYGADITVLVQAQETLRESENRVRAKLDAILLPNGDTSQLELGDILDMGAIQSIMNHLYTLTHVSVAIIDLKGKVLASVGWQDICTKFHRVHPITRQNCIQSDTELSAGIPAGSFRTYKCKNNLWDVSTPLIVGGQHLGNLFLGQFLYETEQPDYDTFREQAREYGFDEQEYLSALDRIPRYSADTVKTVMGMYSEMGAMICSLSFNNLQLARTLETHKRTEEELQRTNAFLDSIVENIPLMVFLKDPKELRFVRFNRAGERLLGRDRADLLGKNDYDFFPKEQADFFIEKDREVIRNKKLLDIPEEFLESSDKGTRVLHTLKVPVLDSKGEAKYLLGISEDVTERKQTEAALRESEAKHRALAEENANLLAHSRRDAESTSILLHEVNHRVKNNMMAVIGLLYAQRRFIPEDLRADFQAAMTDLAGRIETLALVHGMLSAAKWGPLPLSRLFHEILQAVSKLVPYGRTFTYSYGGEDVRIPAQTMNSVALLLFELATNTTKHAFRGQESVHVELTGIWSDRGFCMRYRDNGPGFPEAVLKSGKSNLGLYLVRTLASHDLRGDVTFRNESGGVVEVHLRPGISVQRLDQSQEEA